MKVLVISNPATEEADRQLLHDTLNRQFTAAHIEYELYQTCKEDSLADIVRKRLPEGFGLVVAAGGDGTVSSVGDGLEGTGIPLGIIPSGTGNLIARELEIPMSLEEAIALIAGKHCERKIDGMRIGKRIFFLNAGVGLNAEVIGGTDRNSKKRFGRIAYVGSTIIKMLLSKPQHLIIEVDGKAEPYHAVDVAIINCRMIGKQLYPGNPDIRIDDGHLGVGILSFKKIWNCSWYAIGVVVGWITPPITDFINVEKTVDIRSSVPMQVQADGDIIGTTPVHIDVLPGVLTVLVPEKQNDSP
ncbi:MAG: diacylglycerol kinase family lipid kinase [Kiritimatiellae bacterium]|jgi:YegS/Rv2252/BmrU family lipid kinase|nr:diacylglycerol kinase family lipid kinase [Kiritimatiellia bacterium]